MKNQRNQNWRMKLQPRGRNNWRCLDRKSNAGAKTDKANAGGRGQSWLKNSYWTLWKDEQQCRKVKKGYGAAEAVEREREREREMSYVLQLFFFELTHRLKWHSFDIMDFKQLHWNILENRLTILDDTVEVKLTARVRRMLKNMTNNGVKWAVAIKGT